MKERKMIKLRSHHLICTPRYFRGGYNKKYADNFKKICYKIRKNPDIKIKVVEKCDDICKKCPYESNGICKKKNEINRLILIQDNRVLKALKIKKGPVMKAKDIFNLSIKKIKTRDLNYLCKIKYGCEFLTLCKKYGINKSFLKDLNKK